jgi:peptidoglycan LD-endopeptidase LytH
MKLARTSLMSITAAALLLSACTAGERLPTGTAGSLRRPVPLPVSRLSVPQSGRELYAQQLELEDPAALRSWEAASRSALRSGLNVAPSFRERVRFPAGEAHAIAYRFSLREGQTLRIDIEALDAAGGLYADVFQAVGGDVFRPVTALPGTGALFTARVTGEYVLRLQPQLRGGLWDVVVEGGSSLLFPVQGRGLRDIAGAFGDPRDGGRRRHEGIDIFAPRGTPVLAVSSGRVLQARNTPVGGRIVWVADDASDLRWYFAHLDEIHVTEGSYVAAGDVLGTVGNTGNASGTRPHLHFGAYRPGTIAIDPSPLLAFSSTEPIRPLAVDDDVLGRWIVSSGERLPLRSGPDLAAGIVAELRGETPLLVLGGIADWHRVLLGDGTTGFVAARFMHSTAQDDR